MSMAPIKAAGARVLTPTRSVRLDRPLHRPSGPAGRPTIPVIGHTISERRLPRLCGGATIGEKRRNRWRIQAAQPKGHGKACGRDAGAERGRDGRSAEAHDHRHYRMRCPATKPPQAPADRRRRQSGSMRQIGTPSWPGARAKISPCCPPRWQRFSTPAWQR